MSLLYGVLCVCSIYIYDSFHICIYYNYIQTYEKAVKLLKDEMKKKKKPKGKKLRELSKVTFQGRRDWIFQSVSKFEMKIDCNFRNELSISITNIC